MASTVWRGYITFGLISIPVRLFRAARAERVGLRRLYRPEANDGEVEPPGRPVAVRAPEPALRRVGWNRNTTDTPTDEPSDDVTPARIASIAAPVQQVSVRKGSDEVVAEKSIVKGYEYEKGRFVVVEAEELEKLAPKTSAGMEIQEFIKLADIDPVYFETSYYVTPEEAGQKAYALLYRAMQTTGLIAVAQFAMHSREHVAVLRPGKTGLLAHTMFFTSEVRADEEYRADGSMVGEKELDLAQMLIRSLEAPFEPEKYHDTYRERLESVIAKKVRGEPVALPQATQKPAEVVDIADALRKSLANLKKPVTSEQPRKSDPGRSTRVKRASRGASQK